MKTIEQDDSLEAMEKEQLLRWLNTEKPPSDTEMKNWKQTIATSEVKLIESETYPLTSFSQRLTQQQNGTGFNDHLKHIEINLGIQPNHYNHLFDVEVVHEKTSDQYSAAILDDILKGPHAQTVDGGHAEHNLWALNESPRHRPRTKVPLQKSLWGPPHPIAGPLHV